MTNVQKFTSQYVDQMEKHIQMNVCLIMLIAKAMEKWLKSTMVLVSENFTVYARNNKSRIYVSNTEYLMRECRLILAIL